MIAELSSKKIHYLDSGKGGVIVLLHGFLESSFIWKSLSKKLSDKYRIINIDLPGHGASDELGSDISIDHMAKKVIALLKSLSINKAQVIGHSMGGYVGLALLEEDPERVEQLILLHSKAGEDAPETKLKRDQGMEMIRQHPSLFVKEGLNNLFWKERAGLFKTQIDDLVLDAERNNYKGYIEALEAMKNRPDRRSLLKKFNNIVFIAGRHDPVIPYNISQLEMEMLASGSHNTLEMSGHMGFIEEKEKLEKLIDEVLISA
jgi:pimeloyl-ACP methyl ester carboxylesterase